MAQLTLDIPDDLARLLAEIATEQHKSVAEVVLERLRAGEQVSDDGRPGSPQTVLRAVLAPPHISQEVVENLKAVIAAGRISSPKRELFED